MSTVPESGPDVDAARFTKLQDQVDAVIEAIYELLGKGALPARDLLDQVRSRTHVSDGLARATTWELLRDGKIELRKDQKLRRSA